MSKYSLKDDLLYDKNDNWIKKNNDTVTFGITDFALKKANEVIFLELPDTGKAVKMGERIGSMESTKWSGELISPISGKITKVNNALEDSPERMNKSPYDEGWICEIKIEKPEEIKELMDIIGYRKRIGE